MEDFYISNYSSDSWSKAYNAGYPLNTSLNEGAQSLSSDGNYMFFAACERPDGMGSCDIYYSSFNNGNWSVPVNLKSPVNSSSLGISAFNKCRWQESVFFKQQTRRIRGKRPMVFQTE